MADGPPEAPVTATLGFADRANTAIMPFHVGKLTNSLQFVFNHATCRDPRCHPYLLDEAQFGGLVALTGEQRLAPFMQESREQLPLTP
jgi:hypothetical protein